MGEPPPCRTVYVRNLSPEVDDAELQAMFEVSFHASRKLLALLKLMLWSRCSDITIWVTLRLSW